MFELVYFEATVKYFNHYTKGTPHIFETALLDFYTIRTMELPSCYLFIYIYIGPAVRVFANGPGDLGSIPGRVIPKTLKMELDTTLLNTHHYKVRFKGKVEQSWEWSSVLPYTLV